MINMAYCRFQNTLAALIECRNALEDSDAPDPLKELSPEQLNAARKLIEVCGDLANNFGANVSQERIKDTPLPAAEKLWTKPLEPTPSPVMDDLRPDQKQFLQRNQEVITALKVADRIVKETKTCQHCKYWQERYKTEPPKILCENIKIFDMLEGCGGYGWFEPPPTFGCNKFEAKE